MMSSCSSESLYYVPAAHRDPLLQRLAKHLKPGGAIVATFSQAKRYRKIIRNIRRQFVAIEAGTFTASTRYLIVFRPPEPERVEVARLVPKTF